MEEIKFRHELKHYINFSDYISIKSRLRSIMHIDKNANENNEYKIRSLYFDNVYDYNELSGKIEEAMSMNEDERNKYINLGKQQVDKFTWERCTTEILDVLR